MHCSRVDLKKRRKKKTGQTCTVGISLAVGWQVRTRPSEVWDLPGHRTHHPEPLSRVLGTREREEGYSCRFDSQVHQGPSGERAGIG